MSRWSVLAGVVTALALMACDPVIGNPERTPRVVALFDPRASPPVAPRPNDLALDPATGRLSLVPDDPATQSPADIEFNRYLRTLDGAPVEAVASQTFSAPLAPSTVTDSSVRVLDLTDSAAITALSSYTVSWNETRRRVEVRAAWQKSHRYGIAILGGADGVRGAGGEEVIGSATFALIRSAHPLVTCVDLSSPACRSTTNVILGAPQEAGAQAAQAEGIRRDLQPGLEFLEASGLSRADVVAMWNFRTVTQPLATFDPINQMIPFPNDLIMDGGVVNVPLPNPDDGTRSVKLQLNKLDGFSTTGSIITSLGFDAGAADQPIAPGSLAASEFRLIDLSRPTEQVPIRVVCRGVCDPLNPLVDKEPDQIALFPELPLRSHTRYAALWTMALDGGATVTGQGAAPLPVNANTVFALARMSTPVVDGSGTSQVDGLDDATAQQLEGLRTALQPAMVAADQAGIPRESVVLGWTFITQTTSGDNVFDSSGLGAPQLRAFPERYAVANPGFHTALVCGAGTTACADAESGLTTWDISPLATARPGGPGIPISHIQWAKEGEFLSLEALTPSLFDVGIDPVSGSPTFSATEGAFTPATLSVTGAGGPRVERRKFTLFAPRGALIQGNKVPVVLFLHGDKGSRREAVEVADALAAVGYATLAIDAPMHGDRSFCTASANQCSTTCDTGIHRCTGGYDYDSSENFGGNATIQRPKISGQGFLSLYNLDATRDHFRQQIIDVAQLVRVLHNTTTGIGGIDVSDPANMAPGTAALDLSQPIGVLGTSLGANLAVLVAAAIPEAKAVVLNAPLGSPAELIQQSPSFAVIKTGFDGLLASVANIHVGTHAYDNFLDVTHWLLDPADPQNYARHLVGEPLPDLLATEANGSPTRMGQREVMVSWMVNDPLVPSALTEQLIRSVERPPMSGGFSTLQYHAASHAFLVDQQMPAVTTQAQLDSIDWLTHRPPPSCSTSGAGTSWIALGLALALLLRWRRRPVQARALARRRADRGARVLPLLALTVWGVRAESAGFAVGEPSARALGEGAVGTAGAVGGASVYYNPGNAAFEDGLHLEVSALLIAPSFTYRPPADPTATPVSIEPQLFTIPSLFVTYRLLDHVTIGFGTFANYGLGLTWPATFPGRYDTLAANITTFTFNPAVAVELTEHLGVGVGLDVVRGTVELTQALNFLDQDGKVHLGGGAWGVGVNVGIGSRWLDDRLKVGLSWRSSVPLRFHGRAEFDVPPEFESMLQNQEIATSISLPNSISLGVEMHWTPRFSTAVEVQEVTWSSFSSINLEFAQDATLNQSLPRAWHDTLSVRAGAELGLTDNLQLRAGLGYDPSPSPSYTLSSSLPDSDRRMASLGVGYRWNDLSGDLGYLLVLPIARDSSGDAFPAHYEGIAHVLSLTVGWRH